MVGYQSINTMEKTIFYTPDILTTSVLSPEESLHCTRVLRMKEGEEILVADGAGKFYEAVITNAHQKHCGVNIQRTIEYAKTWNFNLHIAFAPTKNIDRVEWFAEKATEIGIDRFSPLMCFHSERRQMKHDRMEKILISAMKQSQKAHLPQLDELISFSQFIKQDFEGRKFIAHCYPGEKKHLKELYKAKEDVLILIGPEGDFSEQEVAEAIASGFEPITLGESRLRTETAALVACHSIHALNW